MSDGTSMPFEKRFYLGILIYNYRIKFKLISEATLRKSREKNPPTPLFVPLLHMVPFQKLG